ncbi:MAG: hypothetical protein U1F52_22555 [Burkholderiales bacterium]
MIRFERYPHVLDLLSHYAGTMHDDETRRLLADGVRTEPEALHLARFVWRMIDRMRADSDAGLVVLGRIDNGDLLPDVSYEVSLYLARAGFEEIWDRVADDA